MINDRKLLVEVSIYQRTSKPCNSTKMIVGEPIGQILLNNQKWERGGNK